MEDLGDAGWVIALLGITDLFKKEILQPLNGYHAEQNIVNRFISEGPESVDLFDVRESLNVLQNTQTSYRLFHQFLQEMPNLH